MNKEKTTDAMKLCMIVNILEGNPVAYKIKGNNMEVNDCKHCKWIDKVFSPILSREDSTKREYWLMTEVFVYLHDGKDYCKNSMIPIPPVKNIS